MMLKNQIIMLMNSLLWSTVCMRQDEKLDNHFLPNKNLNIEPPLQNKQFIDI